jgi:hypothetical protein
MGGQQPQGARGPQLKTVSIEDIIQDDVVMAERDTPLPEIAY